MKNKKTTSVFLKIIAAALLIAFSFSCKKDKIEPEAIEQTPAQPAVIKKMTAKINGVNWEACRECFTSQKTTFGYYYFMGLNTPYSPFTVLFLGFKNHADTFVISQGNGFAQYKYESGTYFTAKTGTIIISQIDTTSTGVLKRLKGSFNFMTDTINGNSFNITDGIIDYEN